MVNDTWADYEHLAALSDEELCACVRAGNRLAEDLLNNTLAFFNKLDLTRSLCFNGTCNSLE